MAAPETLWFETLGSTNDEAKRRAAEGARGPLWIVAERQTEGHGRQGRSWLSEKGNLTATYLCAPKLVPAQAAQLSFAAALAVADVIDATAPSLAAFKWPNDVLIHGRKIAGILLESAGGGSDGAVQWLAIGIGINLAHHPDGVEFAATSLAAEGLTPPPLAEAMTHLADALDRWMEIHAREGFEPLRRAWLARGPRPGAKLTVRLGNQSRVGVFADLSGEGALILRSDDSTFETVTAGEVFFDG